MYDSQSTIEAIENVYADCDKILKKAQMSQTGYVSQKKRIGQIYDDMGYLNSYVRCAYKRAYDNLDHPLFLGFSKKATETLSRINLGDLKTDNTFKMEEYYLIDGCNYSSYQKRVKKELTMADFLGLAEWEAHEGMPTLENIETIGIFADLFRSDYQGMASAMVGINRCLQGFLISGEYDHKAYHPVRDFVSTVADVTIILPLIESIIGYDFIAGEDLTEFDQVFKAVGAYVDLISLGSSAIAADVSRIGIRKYVEVTLKTMAVDASASGASYLAGEMLEDLGLPPEATTIMSIIVSGMVTYSAGKFFFEDASGEVIEYTEEDLKKVLKGEATNATNDVLKGGSQAIENTLPNVENATINPKKLTEYALNPDHPVGGNKAKVFESALGYNQSNADDLMRQIYEKLPNSDAVLGTLDEYGQRYTVDILISGPNGNIVNVRTGWIIKTGSDVPELTTLFVNN